MFPCTGRAGFLPLGEMPRLIGELMRLGYECLGPTVENGAIAMRGLATADALPRGLKTEQEKGTYRVTRDPANRYFAWANGPQGIRPHAFASRESLWRVARDAGGALSFEPVNADAPKQALIGVRACDLAALAIQDTHFLRGGRVDAQYAARRAALFLVAVQCAEPAATCFCASTGDGPTPDAGYDLALAELAEGFVVEAGSEKGRAVFDGLNLQAASDAQLASVRAQAEASAAAQTRSLPAAALHGALMSRLDHPRWDDVAARCLACANCTLVCPTCFCHAEVDEVAVDGSTTEHARVWDSCFGEAHGHLHGFNARPDVRTRYRQWLTHKLDTWHDQFGRSGCVGCGRCIAWCPTGIDLTEEFAALTAGEAAA